MTQAEALDILKTGANVFLTGEPGSGKTHTINAYATWLRNHDIEPSITASTGIAATHIGGITVHSWSGIGIKTAIGKRDVEGIARNPRLARRIQAAHVLVIDEVSMLAAHTLEAVDAVCRGIRHSTEPFGGLQLVLVGDFFQLPPVQKRDFSKEGEGGMFPSLRSPSFGGQGAALFAFQSGAWRRANLTTCYLSEQHRQEDPIFLQALTAIRRGDITDDVRACFASRRATAILADEVTKLFPHNADVDRVNEAALARLSGEVKNFYMQSHGAPPLIETLKRGCLSPATLALKIGAKVMFTKNNPDGRFANGTTGTVTGFSKMTGAPVVTTNTGRTVEAEVMEWAIQEGGKPLARIMQLPLRLAWAITVHKSQGMSLDAALIDLSGAFEYGQGYVALSRVRTLTGLYLSGINERALEVHPEVAAVDSAFRADSDAAVEGISATKPDDLQKRHTDFIVCCGGEACPSKPEGRRREAKRSTYEQTKDLLLQKCSLAEIAAKRGITEGTVISHIEKLAHEKEITIATDATHVKPEPKRFKKIEAAFAEVRRTRGAEHLSPTRDILGHDFGFDELRLARLFLENPTKSG